MISVDRTPKAKRLTTKQETILEYIEMHVDRLGYPPTVRDIGAEFAIASPNGVVSHLLALEKKGWINRTRLRSRGIKIVGREKKQRVVLECWGKVS